MSVIGTIYVLHTLIGNAAFAALGVIIVLTPCTLFFARKQENLALLTTELSDQRTALMTEVIQGIRVLKQFAWERLFQNRVQTIRDQEQAVGRKVEYIDALLGTYPSFFDFSHRPFG